MAVCPDAPRASTRPSFKRIAGPISIDDACTRSTGVAPALTHLSAGARYFSVFGWALHSGASTDWSGRSVHVSSELESALLAPADHVSLTGSKMAVAVVLIDPSRSLPSGRTQHGASTMFVHPDGVGRSFQ